MEESLESIEEVNSMESGILENERISINGESNERKKFEDDPTEELLSREDEIERMKNQGNEFYVTRKFDDAIRIYQKTLIENNRSLISVLFKNNRQQLFGNDEFEFLQCLFLTIHQIEEKDFFEEFIINAKLTEIPELNELLFSNIAMCYYRKRNLLSAFEMIQLSFLLNPSNSKTFVKLVTIYYDLIFRSKKKKTKNSYYYDREDNQEEMTILRYYKCIEYYINKHKPIRDPKFKEIVSKSSICKKLIFNFKKVKIPELFEKKNFSLYISTIDKLLEDVVFHMRNSQSGIRSFIGIRDGRNIFLEKFKDFCESTIEILKFYFSHENRILVRSNLLLTLEFDDEEKKGQEEEEVKVNSLMDDEFYYREVDVVTTQFRRFIARLYDEKNKVMFLQDQDFWNFLSNYKLKSLSVRDHYEHSKIEVLRKEKTFEILSSLYALTNCKEKKNIVDKFLSKIRDRKQKNGITEFQPELHYRVFGTFLIKLLSSYVWFGIYYPHRTSNYQLQNEKLKQNGQFAQEQLSSILFSSRSNINMGHLLIYNNIKILSGLQRLSSGGGGGGSSFLISDVFLKNGGLPYLCMHYFNRYRNGETEIEEVKTVRLFVITEYQWSELVTLDDLQKSFIYCFHPYCVDMVKRLRKKEIMEDVDIKFLEILCRRFIIGNKKIVKMMSKGWKLKEKSRCKNCKLVTQNKRNKNKRCSRCSQCYYCSRECQIKHWKRKHKFYCCSSSDNENNDERNKNWESVYYEFSFLLMNYLRSKEWKIEDEKVDEIIQIVRDFLFSLV